MTDYDMWTYWRDKYGYDYALMSYYSNDVKNIPELIMALNQLRVAKITIDATMERLAVETYDV